MRIGISGGYGLARESRLPVVVCRTLHSVTDEAPGSGVVRDAERFATALAERGSPFAPVFRGLANAVAGRDPAACAAYASSIEPGLAARQLAKWPGPGWRLVDLVRNLLIFAPIAVTWFGLSAASDAYTQVLRADPELVTQPFLLLWQEGFGGTTFLTFGRLALIDALLIVVVIALSILLHVRHEAIEEAAEVSVLAVESEIHVLLGRARMHAGPYPVGTWTGAPTEVLYERATARERDLEAALANESREAEALTRADELQARAMARLATRPPARANALTLGAVAAGTLALAFIGATFAVAQQGPSEFTRQAVAHARQLEVDLQQLHRDALTNRPGAVTSANLAAAANLVGEWTESHLRSGTLPQGDRPLAARLREAARATHDAAEAMLAWAPATDDRRTVTIAPLRCPSTAARPR